MRDEVDRHIRRGETNGAEHLLRILDVDITRDREAEKAHRLLRWIIVIRRVFRRCSNEWKARFRRSSSICFWYRGTKNWARMKSQNSQERSGTKTGCAFRVCAAFPIVMRHGDPARRDLRPRWDARALVGLGDRRRCEVGGLL